jgi:outer membrane usher protein
VPPGPFSISTPPLVAGDGEVLLKVTDLAGQEQLISQRFYASTVLLADGLSDYSFEAGVLRRNYGSLSNDYGDALVSGGWRHGLKNNLTIEAGASFQQHGPAGLLAGISAGMAGIGIGSMAIGLSHGDAGTGMQMGLGFEQRSAKHSFAARMQFASSDYRQSGIDPAQALRRLDSLFYGYRLDHLGSIGVSYTRQQRMGTEPVSIANISFSSRQSDWGSLGLSLIQTRSDRTDRSLNLFWAMSLGRGTSTSAFHAQPAHGDAQQIVNLQKNMEPGEGWGYRLQAAHNAAQQASVYGQNAFGMGRIEVAELENHTSLRAGLSSGVALLDGKGFLTRRIDSSFGLVRMPGFANVRIYVDNQLAARTDADGFALLPRLYPYMKNNVSVEQLDVPLDAQIDTLRISPVPAWRSGVLIDVPVRAASGATLDLQLDDGTPVPAGATVTLTSDDEREPETFIVGHQGLLYLSGLKAENQLQVRWPGGQCTVSVSYAAEKGSVPHLGRLTCAKARGVQ